MHDEPSDYGQDKPREEYTKTPASIGRKLRSPGNISTAARPDESAIPTAFNRMSVVLEDLHELLNVLENKLDPVMHMDSDAEPDSSYGFEGSMMGHLVHVSTDRVVSANNRIRSILRRVEL
jgi:hypothetical protein